MPTPTPPLSIHEGMIDRHFLQDPLTREQVADPILAGLREALRTCREGGERAGRLTVAVLQNEMMTPAARHRQARDQSWQVIENGTRRLDAARTAAEATVRSLRTEIAAPARRVDAATTILDGEVRSRLAAMTPDQRRAAISEAVASGDEQVLGAVLAGPAMLSGLSGPDEREEIRQRWQTKAHPETLDRIARVERALIDAERAGGLLLTYATSLTDASVIAPAEASERAAQAALAGGS